MDAAEEGPGFLLVWMIVVFLDGDVIEWATILRSSAIERVALPASSSLLSLWNCTAVIVAVQLVFYEENSIIFAPLIIVFILLLSLFLIAGVSFGVS